ncbi:hypothetical protein SAMN05216251_102512 [Actinacidiphila alni]|uniref:Uncharacterized protein n=1 Tax=Actinacidiphila alni TaxID=380248 RepID=A0A1I1ZNY9_9ACTN|nr:hypothetical protein [Actinacidiphila alni]SFE33058.1 hypothetical protein SAMN05216251_102512 [Actinacidiphila alni]
MSSEDSSHPLVHTEIIDITPDKCTEWMKKRACNRVPLKRSNVEKFKTILHGGQFRTTHQGFALDWHGCLIDGQHRAAAIIETGLTVTAQVTYNLDPETFAAIDGGRVRSAGDFVAQITEMKLSVANVYGAALKILANRTAGLHWTRWTTGRLTAEELQNLVSKWPAGEDRILSLISKGRQCHSSATGLLVAYKIITEEWPESIADLFFDYIGEASQEFIGRDPRSMYTNTMLNVNRGVVSRDSVQQSAQAIKAFNALISGESIGTLKKMKMSGVKTVADRRTGKATRQEYLADRYPDVIPPAINISDKWLDESSSLLLDRS